MESIADLFAKADEIGDQYLTAEEIAERDRLLAEAVAEVEELLG